MPDFEPSDPNIDRNMCYVKYTSASGEENTYCIPMSGDAFNNLSQHDQYHLTGHCNKDPSTCEYYKTT